MTLPAAPPRYPSYRDLFIPITRGEEGWRVVECAERKRPRATSIAGGRTRGVSLMPVAQSKPERVCECGCGAAFTPSRRWPDTRFKQGHHLRKGCPALREAPKPSDAEIAWAAGLFEGEGCFTTAPRGRHRYAQACMNMTDEDIVRRFHAVVGVGTVHGPHNRGGNKPRWDWAAGRKVDVEYVALLLADWLGPRRLVQAVSALGQDART